MSPSAIDALTEAELAELRIQIRQGVKEGLAPLREASLLATIATRDAEIARLRESYSTVFAECGKASARVAELERRLGRLANKILGNPNYAEAVGVDRAYQDADEVAVEQHRLAQVEEALIQAALDLGNAAAFFMLDGKLDEAAVFKKCDEAARAALKEPA